MACACGRCSLAQFRIDATVDLDGDGVLEIVATGRPAVVAIYDGRDGSMLFRTAPGSLGSEVGAVRVADLDGDGHADLYVADMACDTAGSGGDVAFALGFTSGFEPGVDDGTSHRLWQLERGRDEACGQNDVVADLDGDGAPEVLALGGRYAYLFDGRTGRKVSSGDEVGLGGYPLGFSLPGGRARTDVVDLDGDGRLEIVAYANNAPAGDDEGLRGVFALDYDPMGPAAERLRVRWAVSVVDPATDVHVFVHDGAADLDGDGAAEVTTTFRSPEGASILVLDGRTGEERAHLEDAVARGLHSPRDDGAALVVAESEGQLRGYRLEGGRLEETVALPPAAMTSRWDRDRWSRASCATGRVEVPLPSGGSGLLQRSGRSVMLYDLSVGGVPDAVAVRELPVGTAVDSVVGHRHRSIGGPGVLLVRTDGTLVVLDAQLRPLSLGADAGPAELRTGGYYSGDHGLGHVPVAGALGTGADTVVVRSSLGALLHLDARGATLARPPRLLWQWQGMVFPALTDVDDDGQLDVVARTESEVRALGADGATSILVAAVVEGGRTLDGDVLPLLDGVGRELLVASSHDVIDGTGQLVALAPDGLAWRSAPVRSAGHGHGWLCGAQLDGAPGDELAIAFDDAISVYAAGSGVLLGAGHHGAPPLPIAPARRGSPVDLISAGAVGGVSGLASREPADAEVFDVVWSAGGERGGRLGALVDCEDGPALVIAQSSPAALLVVDASSGDLRSELFLAGGRSFPSASALDGSGIVLVASATPPPWRSSRQALQGCCSAARTGTLRGAALLDVDFPALGQRARRPRGRAGLRRHGWRRSRGGARHCCRWLPLRDRHPGTSLLPAWVHDLDPALGPLGRGRGRDPRSDPRRRLGRRGRSVTLRMGRSRARRSRHHGNRRVPVPVHRRQGGVFRRWPPAGGALPTRGSGSDGGWQGLARDPQRRDPLPSGGRGPGGRRRRGRQPRAGQGAGRLRV